MQQSTEPEQDVLVCSWQLSIGHCIPLRIKVMQVAQQESHREAQLAVHVCNLHTSMSLDDSKSGVYTALYIAIYVATRCMPDQVDFCTYSACSLFATPSVTMVAC